MSTYLNHIAKIQGLPSELATIKEQMTSFTPKQLETLYGAAFSFYEQNKYDLATGLFTKLVFHNPFDVRFWKGLASAEQMDGNYLAAVRAWGIVCVLQPDSSLPHFHAAECFISLGDQKQAQLALKCAKTRSSESDPLFFKIQLLQERLKS